jgi:hypothetical protein
MIRKVILQPRSQAGSFLETLRPDNVANLPLAPGARYVVAELTQIAPPWERFKDVIRFKVSFEQGDEKRIQAHAAEMRAFGRGSAELSHESAH